MLKRLAALLLCLSVTFLPQNRAFAQAQAPSGVGSGIAMLFEPETGEVLFAQEIDKKTPIASVTKIMTLLIAFERIESGALSLDEMVTVSKNAGSTTGSGAFLDEKAQYSVADLIRTIIISSANDSSVALAEHIAGSEAYFVALMNNKAYELGMNDTVFATCTGLPEPSQYSTAHDVAVMAVELLKHAEFFKYSSVWMDELVHPSGRVTELVNTNRLVRFYKGCDGLKTGYSNEAGHCLVATAVKGETRFIAIVLNYEQSKARFDAASALLDYGFDGWELKTIVSEGEIVKNGVPVKGSFRRTVDLQASSTLRALVKKGSEGELDVSYSIPESINAPLSKGEAVGEITLTRRDGRSETCRIVISGGEELSSGMAGLIVRIFGMW